MRSPNHVLTILPTYHNVPTSSNHYTPSSHFWNSETRNVPLSKPPWGTHATCLRALYMLQNWSVVWASITSVSNKEYNRCYISFDTGEQIPPTVNFIPWQLIVTSCSQVYLSWFLKTCILYHGCRMVGGSLCNFLYSMQSTIHLKQPWTPQPCWHHDRCIMDDMIHSVSPLQAEMVSNVQVYLKITMLSEITHTNGMQFMPHILDPTTQPLTSTLWWPHQQ